MALFVGFLVDTVAMEQVLQFSPVKSRDTIVIYWFLLYHRRGVGWGGACTHYWVQFQKTMLQQPQEYTVGHQIFFLWATTE
jgi:hypothetical protein